MAVWLSSAVSLAIVPVGPSSAAPLDLPPTYPDLVPDVPFAHIGYSEGPPELWFDTWSQNVGTVALDLLADDPTTPTASTVSQCVVWAVDGVCLERRRVGGFSWHDEHKHFHYQDFATYELRRVRRNGDVDYTARGLLALSAKVSFCLMDSVPVGENAAPTGTYTVTCNPFRQGISPGYADIYYSGVPGQQLSLAGLTDGRYAVVVRLNSSGNLYEADVANNVVEAIVDVSNDRTTATVVERRWP